MADLVVGNDLLLSCAEHGVFALRTRDDRLYALLQIRLLDRPASHAHGTQRRLVDNIRKIRPRCTRGRTRN